MRTKKIINKILVINIMLAVIIGCYCFINKVDAAPQSLNNPSNAITSTAYKTYNFTDDEIRRITAMCMGEQSSSETAMRAEASLMANLVEKKYRSGASTAQFISYITKRPSDGGWFATYYLYASPDAKLNEFSASTREKYIKAVKDVLVNGNRYFPTKIDEHDWFGDIVSVSNNGIEFNVKNRSRYKKDVTLIINKYGAIYRFYCFPDNKSDPFGYKIGEYDPKASNVQQEIKNKINQYKNPSQTTAAPNTGSSNNSSSSSSNQATIVQLPNKHWWKASLDFLSDYKGKNTNIGGTTVGSIVSFVDPLITLVKTMGNMIFVAVTVILGVQYIWGSAAAKAGVKDSLVTLVVSALVFYGWNTISALLMNGDNLSFIGTDEIKTATTIYSTVLYICNYLALGGIVYIGIRYMLAGAEGKSQLKTKSIPIVLGMIMVYATITFLNLIVGLI